MNFVLTLLFCAFLGLSVSYSPYTIETPEEHQRLLSLNKTERLNITRDNEANFTDICFKSWDICVVVPPGGQSPIMPCDSRFECRTNIFFWGESSMAPKFPWSQ